MVESRASRFLNLALATTMAMATGAPKNPTAEPTQFPSDSTATESLLSPTNVRVFERDLPSVGSRLTEGLPQASMQLTQKPRVESEIGRLTDTETISDSKPNIVVFMVDDYGMIDNRVLERQKNMRQLFVERGIWFQDYQGEQALCCPGLSNFLTGQEAHNNGVTINDGRRLDATMTIATQLKSAGYETIMSGKYLHNSLGQAEGNEIPGWDNYAIQTGGYFNFPAVINGERRFFGNSDNDYSTDVFSRYGMDFLRNASADNPIFAYFRTYAPHQGTDQRGKKVGTQPPPAPRHDNDPRCENIPPWKPANYNEADVSDKPYYIRNSGFQNKAGWPLDRVCESLLSFDQWVGQVVDELKRQGRYDNTIFVFTTDNARAWGSNRWHKKMAPYASQMPLYISWPGKMGDSSRVNRTLLSSVDLAPTLCEIAGCEMGPYKNGYESDGQSFAGIIDPENFTSIPARDSVILEHLGPGSQVPKWKGIRTDASYSLGEWLYVEYLKTGERELYQMSDQPCMTWEKGDFGDPCMLDNKANRRAYRSVRNALDQLLDQRWPPTKRQT